MTIPTWNVRPPLEEDPLGGRRMKRSMEENTLVRVRNHRKTIQNRTRRPQNLAKEWPIRRRSVKET